MKPEELHSTSCIIWIAVARFIHNNHCPPSMNDIAAETGLGRSTVFNHVKILVESGYLEHEYKRRVAIFPFVWPPAEYLESS